MTDLLRYATSPGSSSFREFLADAAPDLLPGRRNESVTAVGNDLIHATTIVAATFADGVVLAGDRRATMGNLIAQRDIEKVFAADDFSLIGFAGTAGIGIEMIRLFQVELEHYEKIEGTALTLSGKANRLATMIRGNLGAAMQGLVAVPLFVGYDVTASAQLDAARIYSFDPVGSINVERYYHSIGSGSVFAKSALKKLWRPGMDRDSVARAVVESIYDAADDDTATGGPDTRRSIYPIVMSASAEGVSQVPERAIEDFVNDLIADRTARPGS